MVVLPGALHQADAPSRDSRIRDPVGHRADDLNWFCSSRLHVQEMDIYLARDFRDTLCSLDIGGFSSDHRREFSPAGYPYIFDS